MAPEKAIIISTHILDEVPAVCSRAIIIDSGRLKFDGTPHALAALGPENSVESAFRQLTAPAGEAGEEAA